MRPSNVFSVAAKLWIEWGEERLSEVMRGKHSIRLALEDAGKRKRKAASKRKKEVSSEQAKERGEQWASKKKRIASKQKKAERSEQTEERG
jgi:hypothetical protein